MKLFTKSNCPKCDWIKDRADLNNVEVLDAENHTGMAELAYYELFGKEMPILILDNGEVVTGAIRIKKRIEAENGGN